MTRLLLLLPVLGGLAAAPAPVPASATAPAASPAARPLPPGLPRLFGREGVVFARQDAPPAPRKFPTGARPSPRHKLLSAPRFVLPRAPVPAQFAVVPKQLDMWGNDRYGDCVTAEEAFAKACYQPEIFIPANVVIDHARRHGNLNGADLVDVMDTFQRDGFQVGSQKYNDGPYSAVDYSSEAVLQAAISQGPIKIAISSDALPSGAGNVQGWYIFGRHPEGQTDHCTALCGYGPASYCFQALGVPLPSGVSPTKTCYLHYTWSTIGVVDHDWILSTCAEAWLRTPTTVGVPPLPQPTPPVPPTPPPGPNPPPPVPPTPPGQAFTGTLTYTWVNGVFMGVTQGGQPVPPQALEADLKQAGVSPAIITDVLQLIADLKAKKGFAVLLADVFKILTDLQAAQAADDAKTPAPSDAPVKPPVSVAPMPYPGRPHAREAWTVQSWDKEGLEQVRREQETLGAWLAARREAVGRWESAADGPSPKPPPPKPADGYEPELPDGAVKYTPARFTQSIAVTNNRDTIDPVAIARLPDTRWHQSGGMLGVKGYRSDKYKYVPADWKVGEAVVNLPVWNGSNYQNNRGLARSYPVGTEFHDVLVNEKTGKVFSHRKRVKVSLAGGPSERWNSVKVHEDPAQYPAGFTGLKVTCQSCHNEAGQGNYAVGMNPGGDTVFSDPLPWQLWLGRRID